MFEGIAEAEFGTKAQLKHYLEKAVMKLTVHDCDAGDDVLGFWMWYPTPLSRSASPLYLGLYPLIN